MLAALANPQRLRIIGVLAGGRRYVSELAREVRLSRPLVHVHLQRLEAAGLVSSALELQDEGRAVRYFELRPFALHITPEVLAAAAKTLSSAGGAPAEEGEPGR